MSSESVDLDCCKQAKWDLDNVINQNIEEVLSILNDDNIINIRKLCIV